MLVAATFQANALLPRSAVTRPGALPFLFVVLVALPALAALTGRRLREPESAAVSRRAIYLQTALTQAAVVALGLLALRVNGLSIELVGRATGLGVSLAVAVVAGALLAARWHQRWKGPEGNRVAELLLPRTRADRVLWIAALAAAAVGEEVTYRGVLFVLLEDGLGLGLVAALVSAAAFGLGHLAQGGSAAVLSGLFGLGFQAVAAASGGLGLAIAAHYTYDVILERLLGEMSRASPDATVPTGNPGGPPG